MTKGKAIGIAAAVLVTLAASGCAATDQLASVRQFAVAATTFSTQAGSGLNEANDSFVLRNMAKVASGDQELTDATFASPLGDTRGFLESQEAVRSLGAYASSLAALSNAAYGADIDKAATSLYGSLTAVEKDAATLNPQGPKISAADIGVLATLVKGIGEVVARDRQAKAIRQAVLTANPGVQAVCAGIARTVGDLKSSYHKNIDVIYTERLTAYQQESRAWPYSRRIVALQALRAEANARERAGDFLDALSASATALAAAHEKIKNSLSPSDVSPAEVVRAIGELQEMTQELRKFNESLTKVT